MLRLARAFCAPCVRKARALRDFLSSGAPEAGAISAHFGCSVKRGRHIVLVAWKFQPDLLVALWILAPTLAHLDEQKKMHGLLDRFGDLGARRGADRLDGAAALA